MHTVFITRQIPEPGISLLKEKGYHVIVGNYKKPPTSKDIIRCIRKYKPDAILTLLTDQLDTKIIEVAHAEGVRVISNYAVGFNNIDVLSAYAKGIVVGNTPGHFSDCIAEHTVALILGLSTRMVEGDRFMRGGKYKGWNPMILTGTDLSGKTLGLVGAGRIGTRAAYHLVKGFNMKCVYYDVQRNEQLEKELGATYSSNPEGVYAEGDVVSLHVPLLPSTKHMINAQVLEKMKKTALLINTSRGAVVDEVALVEALKKGVIAGAGLDVFEFEPTLARGLAKLENVVLTPHIASARESARREMSELAAQNIIAVFEGTTPLGLVTTEMVK
jgi:glyoxylate reductase